MFQRAGRTSFEGISLVSRYAMSSLGNVDPYFADDLSSGMTPTVVTNFQHPNTGINKDGPYLEIVHQPQSKFRFRYKSEMAGTHGQLKAETSNKSQNLYPTVKLCNWQGGSALIRLTLYTAEENANERRRHVHVLSGKCIDKEAYTQDYEIVADDKNNFTAVFSNLGIVHIARRDVHSIIFQRKKEELRSHACLRNPNLLSESIKHNISPTDLHKLEAESKEEAKGIDLNKVVLRFQAFFLMPDAGCYRPITEPVDSDVIFNLKNASTGELKIVRLSTASAPCTGGTEIWMLVEKVKKSNVKVKFFEVDSDNHEVWKSYGNFRDSDVHHQYAIVLKTPAYMRTNIREPVHVKIQLERPSDNDTSEPLDFTFTPEILKRGNDCIEYPMERESIPPLKKSKLSPTSPEEGSLFLEPDPTDAFSPAPLHKSPSPMVPSPIIYPVSPENQHFRIPEIGSNYMQSPNATSAGYKSPMDVYVTQPDTFESPMYPMSVPSQPSQSSPYHEVPSPSYVHSPSSGTNGSSPGSNNFYGDQMGQLGYETAQHQIQQFDNEFKNFVNKQYNNDPLGFQDLVHVNKPTKNIDILNILEDNKIFNTFGMSGDIHIDSAVIPNKTYDNKHERRRPTKSSSKSARSYTVDVKDLESTKQEDTRNMDSLTDKLSYIDIEDKPRKSETKKPIDLDAAADKDLAFRVAVKAAECLQIYAASGDIRRLLAIHRFLLAVQNRAGDNSLHTAVRNGNLNAFNEIISAANEVFCSDLLNTQNYAGATPLHLAIRENETEMAKTLVKNRECRLDIIDHDGNTPFHLAAPSVESLKVLIQSSHDHKVFANIINKFNYDGQTALHIAVTNGNLNSVKLLVQKGAEVHQCERKLGANPLHLAVADGHYEIAQFLISNTDMTVDAGRFDGNTSLHIAALSADAKMCILLMEAQANPHARNGLRKNTKSESEQDEDENDKEDEEYNEDHYFSVFDYAADNKEILDILNGVYKKPQASKKIAPNHEDSGIGISATDLSVEV